MPSQICLEHQLNHPDVVVEAAETRLPETSVLYGRCGRQEELIHLFAPLSSLMPTVGVVATQSLLGLPPAMTPV
jgi:hypothetical protein